jgi:CRP/FNR family transcriptional regulator, anaerobic regulatory protein
MSAEDNPCADCEVRSLALCGALELEELGPLRALTSEVVAEPGQTVIYEDDPARHLFIVKEGVARLTKILPDGRRQITGFLFPGDFLGLGHGESYGYSAEAVTPLSLCRIERRRMGELLAASPKLEHRMVSIASNEVARAQEQLLLLGRKTARERVANLLMQLVKELEKRSLPIRPLELPMTRADMADYLGLTIETVSRILARLGHEGVIALETPQRVIIKDRDRLASIAEGEEEV